MKNTERKKQTYIEEKEKYQVEIKKKKFNSWKEYCNVAASTNLWSQIYNLAAGKIHANSIITTLRKSDSSETLSIQETMNVLLDHPLTEDSGEDTLHHKHIKKNTEEPIGTSDDVYFLRQEIQHNRQL
jgi:hypothetical protein